MSSRTLNLTSELVHYMHQYGVQEPELLKALREETFKTFEAAPMQICPEQGQFFRFLLKLMSARKCLEIGTFTGYSACCIALALPEDGHLTCCDLSKDWTRLAKQYWEKMNLLHKITLHLAPALQTLKQLIENGESNTYDFAFIDADKPNYTNYFEYCMKLIRAGGVIAIDNVFWDGNVVNPQDQNDNTNAIRALNKSIAQDQHVEICMLPIGDGLTLAIKK